MTAADPPLCAPPLRAPAPPPSVDESLRRNRPQSARLLEPATLPPTGLHRLALWITERVGTIGFFLVIFSWTALWLGWNLLAPRPLQFDPPMAFVFWLFISNVIQILLMPLIMVGQNIQGQRADARAEHDLAVNMQAEAEIETILTHLEYQNTLLIAMMQKLGMEVAPPDSPASDEGATDGQAGEAHASTSFA